MLHANKPWLFLTTLLVGAQALIACPYEPAPRTPLFDAVYNNNCTRVHELLTKNPRPDINAKNEAQLTVLMIAADGNQQEIVQELLANGADVNAKTDCAHHCVCGLLYRTSDETALIFAAERGHAHVVQTLVQAGADLNMQRKYLPYDTQNKPTQGDSALILATRRGHTETARILILAKANTNLRDNYGCTALMYAAEHNLIDIVSLLLDQPDIQVHLTNEKGQTALQMAPAKSESARLIQDYISQHAQQHEHSRPALRYAC